MKVATVCSGIGSPEQALVNLGIEHEIAFACEIDKYARQTYMANFNPAFMVPDMTKETWEGDKYYADLFIGGIPCQAFSLAGKRLGELDPRGLLFYDFYRYVQVQQPKYFIIENVKGLLSDDNGKTFRNWIQLLGRSENTHVNMFNHPDSLEYNLHWKVLNSKDFGVPQNRERVFIVGIRKDLPNTFRFPIGERLKLRLKDVLEPEVDEKYYLSEKLINGFMEKCSPGKGYEGRFDPDEGLGVASTITARYSKMGVTDPYVRVERGHRIIKAGQLVGNHESSGRVYSDEGLAPTITAKQGGGHEPYVRVKEATKQGYAIANEGDSINLLNQKSSTRRGRVGKQIANTLDTACNQAVVIGQTTNGRIAGWHENENTIGAHMGDTKRSSVSEHNYHKEDGICTTVQTAHAPKVITHRIRRLTPLECFRLQGFPDNYIKPCSDSQTYKQAGNSITVNVMQAILQNLLT